MGNYVLAKNCGGSGRVEKDEVKFVKHEVNVD